MTNRFGMTLAAFFAFAPTVPAQSEVQAIIEKAIAAHGGSEKLDRFLAGRVQSKGSITVATGEVPFSSNIVYQLPDRIKNTIEFTTPAGPRSRTLVLNGDKVGVLVGGIPQQVIPAQAEEIRQAAHSRAVIRLTPLLKGDRYKLAEAGDKEVAGKPAVGVKVSADGRRDIRAYFDKSTGLLLALERQGFDAEGKPVEQQELLSDYRVTDGFKYPARTVVMQDGRKYIVSDVQSFKPLTKVDLREFAIPQ